MFLVSRFKEITSLLIVIKYSAFPLIEVSASEVPAILKKFVSKEATLKTAILKRSWQPGRVYVTPFRPARNWREREKPKTDLASCTRSAKFIFIQAIIRVTIFNAIISEFGACLAQNNYGSRAAISPWEAIGTKFLGRNDVTKHGLAAEYCSKWRQRRSNFGLLWRRIS